MPSLTNNLIAGLSPVTLIRLMRDGRLGFSVGPVSIRVACRDATMGHLMATALRALYGDHLLLDDAEPGDIAMGLEVRRSGTRWFVNGWGDDAVCTPASVLAHFEWAWHRALGTALLPAVSVHGGAVTTSDGRVLALIGMSGSGKSTLLAAMGEEPGSRLIADEHLIWTGGAIVAIHAPVGIKGDAIGLLQREVPTLRWGPEQWTTERGRVCHAIASTPARGGFPPPTVLVFPTFEAGAAPSLTPLRRSAVLMQLVHQSHNAHHAGQAGFDALTALADRPAVAARFGSLADGIALMRHALGGAG